jgi:uncharacterized protein (UPF0261 family)
VYDDAVMSALMFDYLPPVPDSVVDIAGMNSVLGRILSNAAGAIAGMTTAYAKSLRSTKQGTPKTGTGTGKRIGITMFGVTTPCVDTIRRILTSPPHDTAKHEIYVFHATGAGGLAMERLVREGQLDTVIDLTTTEVCDHLSGGVLSAGPTRLEAGAEKGIPMVVSVGACDMVNFGPKDTVPAKYKDRKLFEHNPAVTLMRTNEEECREIGKFIAEKLKTYANKPEMIRVLLPTGGVSMIDKPGQPFHGADADEALFSVLEGGLSHTKIKVTRLANNVNDDAFAEAVVEALMGLITPS